MQRIISVVLTILMILGGFEVAFQVQLPYALAANHAPDTPTLVFQYRANGDTNIPEGGTTPQSTVVFKAIVRDPDLDLVRLEIELRQMSEVFIGHPLVETVSDYVFSGSQVSMARYGLVNAEYKWQYRARDANGAVSPWTEFGVTGNVDFVVSVPPVGPAVAYVDPSTTYTNVGQTFSVGVGADVNNLCGFDFNLFWETNLLDCVVAIPNPPWTYFLIANNMDDNYNSTHGRYWCAYARQYPGLPFSGTTHLATLIFDVQTLGYTALDLTDVALSDCDGRPIDGWDGFKDSQDDGSVISAVNHPPVARFSVYPVEPEAGKQVILDASSSYDPDGSIVTYDWDWDGDGDYDDYSGISISRTSWIPNYTVNVGLRVVDDSGVEDTFSRPITIRESYLSWLNRMLVEWYVTLSDPQPLDVKRSEAPLGFWPDWFWDWWRDGYKQFALIDKWLRELDPESEQLGWLKDTRFDCLEVADVIYILDIEVDKNTASGFTYQTWALNAINEEQLVHTAMSQPTPRYNHLIKPLLKYAFGTVWSLTISEQAIIDLNLPLGLGVSTIRTGIKTLNIKNVMEDLEKTKYSIALGAYFRERWFEDSDTAWNTILPSARLAVPDDATAAEEAAFLENMRVYFEWLWVQYEGETHYDPTVSPPPGLPTQLRRACREHVKNELLSVMERYSHYLPNRKKCGIRSPAELRISDPQNRTTGVVDGVEHTEIPNSVYDNTTETVTVVNCSDTLKHQVVGTEAGAYGLEVTSMEDGEFANFTATSIPTSAIEMHQFTINWTSLSLGEDGVHVQVDSDGDRIFDYNFTSDGELNRVEYVATTTEYDLGIIEVTLTKGILGEGYPLLVNITIMNYGVNTETFNITISVNTTQIALQTVTLGNVSLTTNIFTWNTSGFTLGKYMLTAFVDPISGETYIGDNTITKGWIMVTLPGDVDGNRGVDIFDIVAIAGSYGSGENDPNYNPYYDIDGDSDIDIFDVVAACSHYGESW